MMSVFFWVGVKIWRLKNGSAISLCWLLKLCWTSNKSFKFLIFPEAWFIILQGVNAIFSKKEKFQYYFLILSLRKTLVKFSPKIKLIKIISHHLVWNDIFFFFFLHRLTIVLPCALLIFFIEVYFSLQTWILNDNLFIFFFFSCIPSFFIHWFIILLVHSIIHSWTLSLFCSFILSFVHFLFHLALKLIYLYTLSFILLFFLLFHSFFLCFFLLFYSLLFHSFIHSFFYTFIHSFIDAFYFLNSFIYSFLFSLILLFFHSFIHFCFHLFL